MKIFLVGYMGSGKSYMGKLLSQHLSYPFFDLDEKIESDHGAKISDIFKTRGEIFFRKAERKTLEEMLQLKTDAIVSLGGGTPCYGDNMDIIKAAENVQTFYLKLDIASLKNRLLPEKDKRPVISHLETHEELEEFIRKHLFERGFYYNQSDHIIDCSSKSASEIIASIESKLR